jgi:peptidyl-prolyl cis-trans isomerase C
MNPLQVKARMNIRRRISVILFLLVLSFLPSCRNRGEASSPVLIRVDGRTVTLEQFKKDFASSLPGDQNLSADEKNDLERSFLVQDIDRELALAEADRLGVAIAPEEVEAALQGYRRDYPAGAFDEMLRSRGLDLETWRGELKEELLMEKVIKQAVYSKVTVSDKEVGDYFREHREEFDRPAQVRARQIVVATEAEGQRILGLLRQGESFEEVARKYSLSPDAEQGGDLGFFARGEMPPEFDAVVFTLPAGRLSDLVKSEYGYHIFRVEERREAVRLTLDAVQDDIRQKLVGEKEEQAYHDWLQDLRTRATIEVNWKLL